MKSAKTDYQPQGETMPKNIVICSDGTGNESIKGRGTNVFKLFEAVDQQGYKTNFDCPEQKAFYDDGVGTRGNKVMRAIGGAVGWGLSRNVKRLYEDLSRVYEPGDKIFLFGFSRGAFTVRELAGLISTCGIVNRKSVNNSEEFRSNIEEAYKVFKKQYRQSQLMQFFGSKGDTSLADAFRRKHSVIDDNYAKDGKVFIEFIGVWDTVDAVGLPYDRLSYILNLFYCYKFPDFKLSKQVRRACHAISVDDERHTFHPLLWDEKDEIGDRIEQVWFPGVHSNVGGGYPKQGVSIVSLDWMMTKAEAAGLHFIQADRNLYHSRQNANDKLYDSRSGFANYYRYLPRNIGEMCAKKNVTPKIHISVIERIVHGPENYTPGNIPRNLQVVETVSGLRSSNLEKLSEIIRGSLGEHQSMLDRVKWWVKAKQYSNESLILFTVLAMVSLNIGWMVLLLLMPLYFAISYITKGKLEKSFSSFWYPLLDDLRKEMA